MEPYTWCGCCRYQKAQAILFGNGMDVGARFNVSDDEKGQILLQKIFEVYQEGSWGLFLIFQSLRVILSCFVFRKT